MRINCKPILVTLISEFPLLPSKYRHWGHLVLMEEDVQPSDTKFGGKNVEVQSEFYMDDPNFHEQQQAYIVAIQRCFHVRHIEDGAPSQKLHAGQIKDVDILGGLILQPQDKDLMTFSRIGIFDVRGTATVSIFNAHLKAQERVITLV
ncbi:hypothetical protein COCMIDRAFT_95933 [Bipolaris oryzae ATCC 44560]|uniref:Uncharacterized protein n=1 Tax=Bipolaris oryzae ATCC 44560 TaxID=930090 RepID=W6Z0L5_COCMI|nr:uncharacterized protein COCMIDRAFT_95933 [Bipolaris oryzae ATCC 44560]EUC45292.1 hypothetical protein COCMIDRAFT_95933 [Bipolaris oryzae ATCC 44560]